jgi:putative protein-disulfide isomerase
MEFKLTNFGVLSYYGDPMCSWCWGITPHLERIMEYFKLQLKFETVLGGLRPGGGEPWSNSMKEMLQVHWEHVQARSGQEFNYNLLQWNSFNYDTEPSCRAVRVARDLIPKTEYDFFKEIQFKFYVKNEDPTKLEFYQSICEKFEISFQIFKERFSSDDYKKLVKEDFIRSSFYGITSFPSLVLTIDDRIELITKGYSDFESMRKRIETVLKIPFILLN